MPRQKALSCLILSTPPGPGPHLEEGREKFGQDLGARGGGGGGPLRRVVSYSNDIDKRESPSTLLRPNIFVSSPSVLRQADKESDLQKVKATEESLVRPPRGGSESNACENAITNCSQAFLSALPRQSQNKPVVVIVTSTNTVTDTFSSQCTPTSDHGDVSVTIVPVTSPVVSSTSTSSVFSVPPITISSHFSASHLVHPTRVSDVTFDITSGNLRRANSLCDNINTTTNSNYYVPYFSSGIKNDRSSLIYNDQYSSRDRFSNNSIITTTASTTSAPHFTISTRPLSSLAPSVPSSTPFSTSTTNCHVVASGTCSSRQHFVNSLLGTTGSSLTYPVTSAPKSSSFFIRSFSSSDTTTPPIASVSTPRPPPPPASNWDSAPTTTNLTNKNPEVFLRSQSLKARLQR